MQGTLPQRLGTDQPTIREWLKNVGNMRVPRKPTIHADWVVIGLATVAQSFIVGFWSYTRFFVLPRAGEIPFGFQLAFAIIAGLALDAAVIFSATSGLESAPWNLDTKKGPISLGGWATWTPFIAFGFSSFIAVDTFAIQGKPWDGSELLHVGWPTMVFALSKYGAALRHQRKAREATENTRVAGLEVELIQVKAAADAMVEQVKMERAAAEQSATTKQILLDGLIAEFKGLRELWEMDRALLLDRADEASLRAETERTSRLEFTTTIDQRIKQAMDTVRAEERKWYDSEIARERTAWMGAVERVNEDWIVMNQCVQNSVLEIDSLMQLLAQSRVFLTPSEQGEQTQAALSKMDKLRKFFGEFAKEHGCEPTNADISKHFDWPVNTFDTLAGRVRRERKEQQLAA